MIVHSTEYANRNRNYWSHRAAGYSKVNQEELETSQHEVWKNTIATELKCHFGDRLLTELKVLDIGTGPGFFAILLTEMGCQVTAVDYTEEMLKEARNNAADLAEKIDFCQMDGQNLTFSDASFDVIISRNLTWNLQHPDQAYSHWTRVLKEGGLLLNFDANWYRFLYDAEAEKLHLQDREKIKSEQVEDETEGTDVEEMEAIAGAAFLTKQMRPEWDREVLTELGMDVSVDLDIWKTVWTRTERVNNQSTPMFLIRGVKRGRS